MADDIVLEAVPALRIDHVTKTFPGVVALDDVDLTVRAGEVHGIVGENGAGKSTLMAVASGALVPDAGTVSLGGRPLRAGSTHAAQELGMAIVLQEPALLPDLTVAENMYLGQPPAARPPIGRLRSWSRDRLRDWSEEVGIDPDSRIEELEPEKRFIVDIVRALAHEPAVLVLDEPTEHLAGEDVERLFAAVRERVRDGGAVVYISHRIREVKEIADRISVLRDGCHRGTFDTQSLAERDIVDLIVGRRLDAVFPDKPVLSDAGDPVLRVETLRGRGFEDLTFDVGPGEIVGFAGIEGNGQRDALRALAGLGHRTGSVSVDGAQVRRRSAAVAYLTGDRHREGVFPGLTVRETIGLRNLDRFTRLGVVEPRREREFARTAVADLAVKTPSIDTPIESLSGGNQQKALLAGVLRRDPRVLLIDEPTQGVDIGAKSEIYDLLRDSARDRGMGVVVVSSDGIELAGLCDRVLIFSRGHVVEELVGDDISESRITGAALTATTHREKDTHRAGPAVRWFAGDTAPMAMVALAVLGLGLWTSLTSSFYLTTPSIAGLLALVAVLGFVALGQTVALMIGAVDLSVGPLMGFVVVAESFFLTAESMPLDRVLGWVLLFAIPLAVGLVNWALVDVVRMNAIVATLITYIALQALSLVLRPQPGGLFDSRITEALTFTLGPVPIAFILMVIVAAGMQFWLRRTRTGIALRSVGSEPERARLNGLGAPRLRLVGFLLCSLLAGLAALFLLAQVGSGDPTSGVDYTLTSISAAVIGGASIFGGRGSFVGTIAAALLVTQAIGAVTFLGLDAAWSSYLPGAMTLVAVAVYSRTRHLARTH
ncbi:Monosaccharide-transporting ATPase [Pseudonocardia dioxanivorans CB1190]|uniref:Monosaccharide-transporting ATPase n=1 Tax=Pseudonocardia dioxanivorans (strain ATCC 55486 / DSM 44775 / JCM 13855 / CB1190) TaxID=675635 RepID=F4CPH5_PSEUX|nr:ATP-binding cassette domain-containing protein [Pseudonocardia dioxanivorans]AEA24473.1 Monosaccharide-transporting ATPase [Pseudonocardia dioxanivorans CB1190]